MFWARVTETVVFFIDAPPDVAAGAFVPSAVLPLDAGGVVVALLSPDSA